MLRAIDQGKCIGCGSCFKTCGFDVFRLETGQASRPQCQAACPAGIDIRGYVHLLQQGKTAEAVKVMLKYNPIPALTCRVCNRFCESRCARKGLDDAVHVHALEQYLGDWLLDKRHEALPISRAGKVAVVGSGAAGLAAAFFLLAKGYPVTVFEKDAEPGGRFRTEKLGLALRRQIRWLEDLGVAFQCGAAIGDNQSMTVHQLRENGYKAVLLATGTEKDKSVRQEPPFASIADISADRLISVDLRTMATRTRWVFAAGPARGCPQSAPHEIADARSAADSVDRYLSGWDLLEDRSGQDLPLADMPMQNIPAAPRFTRSMNKKGVNNSLSYEDMQLEAARCLTCGSKAMAYYKDDCMTCFFCEMACPVGAILVDPIKEGIPRTIEYPYEGVQ